MARAICAFFLEVRCLYPGCLEMIPPEFVLQVSPEARTRPAALDLKAQLQVRILGDLYVPMQNCNRFCSVCQGCENLIANTECRHAACVDCWTNLMDKQIPSCQELKIVGTRCIRPGCKSLTMPALLSYIAEQTPLVSSFSDQIMSEVRRLKHTAGDLLHWGDTPSEAGPICSFCQQRHLVLLTTGTCQHAACELCWTRSAEKQLQQCRARCTFKCLCLDPGCAQEVSSKLLHHLITLSVAVRVYKREMDIEIARLTKTAEEVLVFAGQQSRAGPVCQVCHKHKFALLENRACRHAACEQCWTNYIEDQLSRFRSKCLPHAYTACFHLECSHDMPLVIETHACTQSEAVNQFRQEMAQETKRLMQVSGQALDYGPCPFEAGPECPVCRERCLALLSNPNCNHAACEDCWANLAVTYLPRCRSNKRACVRCIGPGCQESASAALWLHSGTRNELVQHLEGHFAFRRRLQSNILYPAEVQVECPQSGCVGLGYRGFDTIMCFICEHQWSLDDDDDASEPAPTEIDIELMKGDVMKKCPRCGELIIKNGGCDHMTCCCGYEFWWSTLLPYRRQ